MNYRTPESDEEILYFSPYVLGEFLMEFLNFTVVDLHKRSLARKIIFLELLRDVSYSAAQ